MISIQLPNKQQISKLILNCEIKSKLFQPQNYELLIGKGAGSSETIDRDYGWLWKVEKSKKMSIKNVEEIPKEIVKLFRPILD